MSNDEPVARQLTAVLAKIEELDSESVRLANVADRLLRRMLADAGDDSTQVAGVREVFAACVTLWPDSEFIFRDHLPGVMED